MFAFVTKFPRVATANLSLRPTNGAAEMGGQREIYAYTNPKRAATAHLTLDGQDVAVKLVAGGWKGDKMYYAYFFVDGRSSFMPLTADEYASFKVCTVTLTTTTKYAPKAAFGAKAPADTLPVTNEAAEPAEHLDADTQAVLAEIQAEIAAGELEDTPAADVGFGDKLEEDTKVQAETKASRRNRKAKVAA